MIVTLSLFAGLRRNMPLSCVSLPGHHHHHHEPHADGANEGQGKYWSTFNTLRENKMEKNIIWITLLH